MDPNQDFKIAYHHANCGDTTPVEKDEDLKCPSCGLHMTDNTYAANNVALLHMPREPAAACLFSLEMASPGGFEPPLPP
jgi:hypothetical protein